MMSLENRSAKRVVFCTRSRWLAAAPPELFKRVHGDDSSIRSTQKS